MVDEGITTQMGDEGLPASIVRCRCASSAALTMPVGVRFTVRVRARFRVRVNDPSVFEMLLL